MTIPNRSGGAVEYGLIAAGTAVTALGVNMFYAPSHIADGGVTGLAIIGWALFRIPLWVTLAAVNFPLLWLSHRLWGGKVGRRTVFGTLMLAFWVGVLHPAPPTHDLLLAAVYGGLLSGVGLGLVFRSRGTTGGTDVVARFLAHALPVTVGQGMLLVDSAVITAFGIIFRPTAAMYSLIALFVSTRAIDVVQEGVGFARQALIFSDHHQEIGRRILAELGRGATLIPATGLYSAEPRPVLYVVVGRPEVTKLKTTVYAVDPQAFMVIGGAHEVVGQGFRVPPPVE
jgi:uncharacterized membrane-anchored protein YitT (DUF2179 family)